jgi:3-phenylpropionate/trans-cinnamate dioxygenase ferredoxin component
MSVWADVGGIADLEASSHLEAEVDGFRVRITRVNGTLYAFEDRCTHDGSPFDDAIIEDCEIICPRHGARFSLRSGEALSPPAYEPLRIFDVREAGERIEVRV